MKPALFVLFLVSTGLYAQQAAVLKKSGSWNEEKNYKAMVSNGKPVTVSGTVLRSDTFSPFPGMDEGINVQLKTGDGVLNVQIGPQWYTTSHGAALQPGEPMTVVGLKITFDKEPAIVAKEITLNGKKFTVWEKRDQPRSTASDKSKDK